MHNMFYRALKCISYLAHFVWFLIHSSEWTTRTWWHCESSSDHQNQTLCNTGAGHGYQGWNIKPCLLHCITFWWVRVDLWNKYNPEKYHMCFECEIIRIVTCQNINLQNIEHCKVIVHVTQYITHENTLHIIISNTSPFQSLPVGDLFLLFLNS